MGFPIARLAGRAAFIGAIIAGGLLAAGIAQAQAQTLASPGARAVAVPAAPAPVRADDGFPTLADRQAELVAAAGGPAPTQHLMMAAPERPAVEEREDDVQDAAPDASAALNAAELAHDQTTPPSADPSTPR